MLRSRVLPLLGLAAFISTASGCGCGRGPGLMKTESSLSLPQEVLDFGPVVEGTSKQAKFTIENTGRSSVGVSAALKEGSSGEFELGPVTPTVDALGFIEVAVTFTPAGPGEDEGFVEVQSAQPDTLPLTLRLHGGPIAPGIEFDPDPVDFNPSTMLFEAKTARVKSVGTSALNVRAIGVAGNGNPDFSVVPPTTPARLLPGESLNVRVEYSRSARDAEGRMEVLSDAEDAGTAWLRLIPDPPAKCCGPAAATRGCASPARRAASTACGPCAAAWACPCPRRATTWTTTATAPSTTAWIAPATPGRRGRWASARAAADWRRAPAACGRAPAWAR